MARRALESSTPTKSGDELVAALRQDYGTVDIAEMFQRYRQMYRSENVAIEQIAAFTAVPADPLLVALQRKMPAQNKYHGATNVNVNIVRRRARELSRIATSFNPSTWCATRKASRIC